MSATEVKVIKLTFNANITISLGPVSERRETLEEARERRKLFDCSRGLTDDEISNFEHGSEAFLCKEVEKELDEVEILVSCDVYVLDYLCFVYSGYEFLAVSFE